MKVNEFGETTLISVEKALETIDAIDPILQDMQEEYSIGEIAETSEVTMRAAAMDYKKPSNVRLSSAEVQRALGFMAYNNVIELKGDKLFCDTSNRHKKFDVNTYDPEICEDLVNYLNKELSDYKDKEVNRDVKNDFNNFENHI